MVEAENITFFPQLASETLSPKMRVKTGVDLTYTPCCQSKHRMNGYVHRHHFMTIKTLNCCCCCCYRLSVSVHVMWLCPSFMWQVCTWLHYHYVNCAEFLKLGWHRTHFVRHFVSLSRHQLAFYTAAQQKHRLHGVNSAQQIHQLHKAELVT